ncbi:MAG TPA: hypothetical protein VD996_13705 [Chitinophagaceae bacterium]|nr:hypothetical protein [Chitinophagaceae bacterium]
MKKFLFLTLIFGAIISSAAHAQGTNTQAQPKTQPQLSADQAAMLQQMKDRFKAPMVEKTGLTEAQADKVIEINFELRQSMIAFKDLSEADRAKKVAELKVTREKRYSEIPLTPEQIKAVLAFYENMGRNAPPRSGN